MSPAPERQPAARWPPKRGTGWLSVFVCSVTRFGTGVGASWSDRRGMRLGYRLGGDRGGRIPRGIRGGEEAPAEGGEPGDADRIADQGGNVAGRAECDIGHRP